MESFEKDIKDKKKKLKNLTLIPKFFFIIIKKKKKGKNLK
jgi:hypothetical protein